MIARRERGFPPQTCGRSSGCNPRRGWNRRSRRVWEWRRATAFTPSRWWRRNCRRDRSSSYGKFASGFVHALV